MMATTKRKIKLVEQDEFDYEYPILNGKKSKTKSKSKIGSDSTLSRWPDDVSNTFQSHSTKNKFSSNIILYQIPDEIILLILSYLNRSSVISFGKTCRRYRAISYHPSLWRRIDMSYKRIDNDQLRSLLQRGTVTLKMYQTTVEEFNKISIQNSCLRHLDLTSAIISTEFLINLLHSCTSLRKLSLESISLNNDVIKQVARNDQLDTLNLAMCTGLTYEGCQLIISKLSLLRSLNLAWTGLSAKSMQLICETVPRCIEQLNISGQRYHLTDNCIHSLVRRAVRLRVLDISDSVLLTDQSIILLRQHSRLLTHLSASRCYLFTSLGLITLKLLPAFGTLDIFGTLAPMAFQQLRDEFGTRIRLNTCPFSNIARPTTGIQRTSIWGLRTRL